MFKSRLSSLPLRALRRTASTVSSSRAQFLQKKSDDVVITFAKRTAMGRAKKGQLKDVPVDELLHALFKVLVVVALLCIYFY
jgi:acetyl-CoA acyltransferase 1